MILVAGVPPRGAVGSATFGNKIKLGEQIIVALGARAIIGTTTGSSSSSTPITYRAIMAPGGAGVVSDGLARCGEAGAASMAR